MSKTGFRDDPDSAQFVVSQLSAPKAVIEPVVEMRREVGNVQELFEPVAGESDQEELRQLEEDLAALLKHSR